MVPGKRGRRGLARRRGRGARPRGANHRNRLPAHLELAGQAPLALQDEPPAPPRPTGQIPIAVIANGELVDRFSIRRAALHAIRASLGRIYLASPYFVPDPGFLRSLANAASRGVDVRLLVPRHSDTQTVDLASRATYARLLPAGVRIFQHHPLVHTKALLVDEHFVSLGSYNLDHRSLVYNLELVVNSIDRAHNEQVAAMLLADMTAGQEILWEQHRKRGWLTRLLERLAYAFRHWF
jgi:cardiolipin synthase